MCLLCVCVLLMYVKISLIYTFNITRIYLSNIIINNISHSVCLCVCLCGCMIACQYECECVYVLGNVCDRQRPHQLRQTLESFEAENTEEPAAEHPASCLALRHSETSRPFEKLGSVILFFFSFWIFLKRFCADLRWRVKMLRKKKLLMFE